MRGIRGEVYDACGSLLGIGATDFGCAHMRFLNTSHINLIDHLARSLRVSLGVLGPSVRHGTKGVCIGNRWDV